MNDNNKLVKTNVHLTAQLQKTTEILKKTARVNEVLYGQLLGVCNDVIETGEKIEDILRDCESSSYNRIENIIDELTDNAKKLKKQLEEK